jgi:hypothetical protein
MKYCNTTTINHPIAQTYSDCLQNINHILFNDSQDCHGYIVPNFENNEIVINLDDVETKLTNDLGRLEKNMSMDLAFGLSNSDSTNQEMLMVELRLNYLNPNNLKKEKIDGKVTGSILALGNHTPIHEKYIFIFKTNQVAEAKNRLFRMIPTVNSNYIVMDLENLKSIYFN